MKPKLLIVDDSPTVRTAVVNAFSQCECELLQAQDGAEGLLLAEREKPDLLLLDLAMPGMDGPQMLSKLRSCQELKKISVIVLTSDASKPTVVRMARLGVRDYLLKPFTDEALLGRARQLLDLKGKGEDLPAPATCEDPLVILLVDPKPAVAEQLRAAVAGTQWRVEAVTDEEQALSFCVKQSPHVVLASLFLPEQAAFGFPAKLRSALRGRQVPLLGVCLRNAADEQNRAREAGYDGFALQPFQAEELQARICRKLNLDVSAKYMKLEEGILHWKLSKQVPALLSEVLPQQLHDRLTKAVTAGCHKLAIDLGDLEQLGPKVVRQVLDVLGLCRELAVDYCLIGSEALLAEFRRQTELRDVAGAAFWEDALQLLNSAPTPTPDNPK